MFSIAYTSNTAHRPDCRPYSTSFCPVCPLLCVVQPLQRYIATASVAYQREIVRLYTALQKLDPLVKPPLIPKAAV